MKLKDKYDLRDLHATITHQVSGCGRQIKESRTINIFYKERKIKSIRTQDGLLKIIMNYLESEEQ